MTLTNEQAKKIKEQLLAQLANFPEDKRDQMKAQITSMDNAQLESFLEQNNLMGSEKSCLFCSIASGQTPSFQIGESNENIAILEINPLSKGHALIVPKKHLEKAPDSSHEFAKLISEKIKNKFKPKEIKVGDLSVMGHGLLEIIPIYGNETQRKKLSEEELKKLQEEVLGNNKKSEGDVSKKESATQEVKATQDSEAPKFKPRMP
jgi:histidine triad (HIT) family protein